MSILLVGLNHQSAPVALREQLALSGANLRIALEMLYHQLESATGGLHEAVILSTCNRFEIYAAAPHAEKLYPVIEAFIAERQPLEREALRGFLYTREDEGAVRHAMRVACGLESLVFGEAQIPGQMAQAFDDAHEAGTTGPILSHLFAQALHAGKRARTETEISRHSTSVSSTAALLLRDRLADFAGANILVIGAGEMASLAAHALKAHGAAYLTCINRTYAKAAALALEISGEALGWSALKEALVSADAIITATGAPHPVIDEDDMRQALPLRGGRPLVIVDIAVPRDVDERVGDLPTVTRYDIDDLQATIDAHFALRKQAAPQVEAIVEQEVGRFLDWLHSREVIPVITDLRGWAESVAELEVDEALHRLKTADPAVEMVIQRLAHRLVNKLLHQPTVRLRACAAEGNGYVYAHAVRELFALDDVVEYADGTCMVEGVEER